MDSLIFETDDEPQSIFENDKSENKDLNQCMNDLLQDNVALQDRMAKARRDLAVQQEKDERVIMIRGKRYNDMTLEDKEIMLPIMQQEIDYGKKKLANDKRRFQELVDERLKELEVEEMKKKILIHSRISSPKK